MPPTLEDETLVWFQDGRLLEKPPNNPRRDTLANWADIGVTNKRTGKRVFLEWLQKGAKRFTSVEAYRRFLVAQNAEATGEEPEEKL